MIDTHCHLTFPDYDGRIDAVLDEAHAAGVDGAITISTTTHDCLDALAIANAHERVWCSAGVHPLYSDQQPHDWHNIDRVIREPKCVAWGELGLDNHYDRPPKPTQLAVLRDHLTFIESRLSEIDKPVVLHCRDAFAELIPILEKTRIDPARFVFHCFTGGPEDARLVVDFGAWVSFTGVLTYKNAAEVREAAALVPLDRVMVETDAPFLTPMPHRGVRPNEPKFVVHTAQQLADIHGVSFDEMHATLNDNTTRFFGIA
jgi:TatD DNase family protein